MKIFTILLLLVIIATVASWSIPQVRLQSRLSKRSSHLSQNQLKELDTKPHHSKAGHSHLSSLFMSSVDTTEASRAVFTLANVNAVTDLLSRYQDNSGPYIRGVFVIESKDGVITHIGSSADVFSDVSEYRSRHGLDVVHNIRIENMDNKGDTFMQAYLRELISKSNFHPSSLDWSISRPSNSMDSSATSTISSSTDTETPAAPAIKETQTNSKLEELKNKINRMRKEQSVAAESMTSPFATESSQPPATSVATTPINTNKNDQNQLEFTYKNVDFVLNEIRPYLIADGGNVAVVSVDEASLSIKLELQGACGGCPSSTTTMKMGIERILKENFPYVKSIEAVNGVAASDLSIEMIEKALTPVMPSISAMKGELKVTEVDPIAGIAKISFRGPPRLKQGLELILKDIKSLKQIIFSDL